MKSHLKSLAAPKAWKFNRKKNKFIAKPLPGKHGLSNSVSINFMLKEILGHVKLKSEVNEIINKGMILVDSRKIKDRKYNIGLFDVIDIPKINETYRMMIDKKGRLNALKISKNEKALKPLKITGKRRLRNGKIQLNFYDGTNMNVDDNSYKVGDSIIYNLESKKIEKHLPLKNGVCLFITNGKHKGKQGVIENVLKLKNSKDVVFFKKGNDVYSTAKKYAYVVGDKKSLISLGGEE